VPETGADLKRATATATAAAECGASPRRLCQRSRNESRGSWSGSTKNNSGSWSNKSSTKQHRLQAVVVAAAVLLEAAVLAGGGSAATGMKNTVPPWQLLLPQC
jgi:hypothetical protein